tara:strand:- start:2 stop:1513 length:1512 start_codon:yes stop_codon:yes gene_type:complete
MSYENPEQFVDKQSGQHFRRMQESITKAATSTIASYVDTYKRNQIRIQKIREQADKETLDAKNAVFQTASKNSTIQFQNINGKFKRLAELKKKNPTMLTDKERNFIRSMDTIGTRMYSALENTTASSLAFKEQSSIKPGSQGSNDEFRNPNQYQTMMIMNGKIPGSKEAVFDEDENGNVVYSVVVKDANKKIVGKVLNKDMETTLFVDKVPNLQPDIDKAIETTKAILNIGSEFSPAYIKEGELTGKLMVGVNNKGVGVSADLWEKTLKEQVGLITIGLDRNEKSSFHNNITRDKKTIETLWEYDKDLNKYQDFIFSEELFKYANSEVESEKAKNKVMRKAKEPSTDPTKTQQKFNDRVNFAKETSNEINSLMGDKKSQGNKNFTINKKGAFLTVLNKKRLASDSQIKDIEDIKPDFLEQKLEEGMTNEAAAAAWEKASKDTELAYIRNGKIVPVDLSSSDAMNKSILELLIPGIKPLERDKLAKAMRGKEGEIVIDYSQFEE